MQVCSYKDIHGHLALLIKLSLGNSVQMSQAVSRACNNYKQVISMRKGFDFILCTEHFIRNYSMPMAPCPD